MNIDSGIKFGLCYTLGIMLIGTLIMEISAWLLSQIAINDRKLTWVVWLTFIIAEVISCAVSVIFMRRIRKKKLNIFDSEPQN